MFIPVFAEIQNSKSISIFKGEAVAPVIFCKFGTKFIGTFYKRKSHFNQLGMKKNPILLPQSAVMHRADCYNTDDLKKLICFFKSLYLRKFNF